MPRIAAALVVYVFAFVLPGMAFSEDVSATLSDAETASKDAATVKACLDFVDAKHNNADVAGNGSPDVAKGAQKTGPEAYLEAAAKSKPIFDYENCIGIVADACLETDDGQGTLGMMVCYGREYEVWDARLNASYREQTTASSKKAVGETEAKHLQKVQKAWIAWRNATCEVLYADGIPLYGSDAKIESVYCDMVLTARQALSIEGKTVISFEMPEGQ